MFTHCSLAVGILVDVKFILINPFQEDNDKLAKGNIADSKFMQLLNENKKLKQQLTDIEAEKSQKVVWFSYL